MYRSIRSCALRNSVIITLVHVCMPKSIGYKGLIHQVPAKFDQITCTSMYVEGIGENGMIN